MATLDFSPARIRSDLYALPSADRNSPCVLSVLSSLLQRLVLRNEQHAAGINCSPAQSSITKLAVFCGDRAPSVTIEQYLVRMFKYAHCSPSCFVVAYAYIDRLMQLQSQLRITSLNVHRLLITSVMVAAKFLDDIYYDNAYYAKIGGISVQQINKLEIEFLFLLGFRLHITVSVFESYCSHLEREVAFGGGYQIERTLKSICALDRGCTDERSVESERLMTVKCYGGL